jgi:hypothetical protein
MRTFAWTVLGIVVFVWLVGVVMTMTLQSN